MVDEEKQWPAYYRDAETERQHAAEALEEWWTGLAETAREGDDTQRLDEILAEHDTERVDWLLIAEHVLHDDGRGRGRPWDHEIPYDPFTPPQIDRRSYRSADEPDGPGAREPAPPSPAPAHDVPGGTSRSPGDEFVTGIETQELLVDRIDVEGPAGTEAVPSPPPGGAGAAPTDERTTPGHDTIGRGDAPRTSHDETADGGDDSQSRAADEPSLDPWLTNREPTEAQKHPAPPAARTSEKKHATPKRIPQVKPPDPTRGALRERERTNAPTTERDRHGRDDAADRDNAPVVPPPEPVVPPPPPAPAPEPGPDFGFDM
jgi:hypothetical protein